MKTKILFLALILLIGCKSQKKLTENVSQKETVNTELSKDVETKTDLTTSVKSDTKADTTTEQIETETNELETRITTYDTEKPIVPGTNKPPVKEETVITNRKQIDNKTQTTDQFTETTAIDSKYKTSLITEIDSLKQLNASLISKNTSKTTPKSNWYWWVLVGAILVVGIQLAWKFTAFGKLSFLFEKIKAKFAP